MAPLATDNGSLSTGNRAVRLRIEVLDALMREKADSQAEQARLFGISPAHYSRIRAGKRSPTIEIALRMAKAADTTVEALFGRAA